MIRVIVKKQRDSITGFRIEGHSGYAGHGSDIICSAVSALAITCVNSIEEFTEDRFSVETDEERGLVDLEVIAASAETQLLLRSMLLGIQGIETTYGSQYVMIINR